MCESVRVYKLMFEWLYIFRTEKTSFQPVTKISQKIVNPDYARKSKCFVLFY